MLIIFQRFDVYLNQPIEIVEQIKFTNQSNQQNQIRTRDRNGEDNNNS